MTLGTIGGNCNPRSPEADEVRPGDLGFFYAHCAA
jgi:hypothetical protein